MIQKILSETEFDLADESTPSADKQLESHLTYRRNKKKGPISADVNGSHSADVAPGAIIDGSGTPAGDVAIGRSGGHMADPVGSRDKINNLSQKETAMARAGVTREKTYEVIARLLDARKWAEQTDAQGNVRWEQVPDLDKQKLGAEMALKAFGDMVERKEIEYDVGGGVLEIYRKMTVPQLKAKAAELLLGRRVEVSEAEITKGE